MKSPDFQGIKTLDPKAVFSVSEVAEFLGLSHNAVMQRIHRSELKAGRNGKRYFVLGSEVQKSIKLPDEVDI